MSIIDFGEMSESDAAQFEGAVRIDKGPGKAVPNEKQRPPKARTLVEAWAERCGTQGSEGRKKQISRNTARG